MTNKFCVSLIATGLLLSGCDSVRNTFGLDHYQADEMQTPRLAALTIPPNFQLRPPRPGAPSPNQVPADASAKNVLLNNQYSNSADEEYDDEEEMESPSSLVRAIAQKQKAKQNGVSEAEAHLLSTATMHAGTGDNEDIRGTIDAEASEKKL